MYNNFMDYYTEIMAIILAFFVGAGFGSFACCQAWRLHFKEKGKKSPGKWSVCLSCNKRLKFSENIPIFSWLFQRGRCKKCGAKIGLAEIFSELSLGSAFAALCAFLWPEFVTAIHNPDPWYLLLLIGMTLMLLISIIVMWILLVYDAKWQKLPTLLLTILNACAIIYAILRLVGLILGANTPVLITNYLTNLALGALILGGLYYMLSTVSRGKLVGSGDWLVALPIALILGHWWLAIITLLISNLLGSFFGIFARLKNGARQIPFGPFLVIAFVITYACQNWLLTFISAL